MVALVLADLGCIGMCSEPGPLLPFPTLIQLHNNSMVQCSRAHWLLAWEGLPAPLGLPPPGPPHRAQLPVFLALSLCAAPAATCLLRMWPRHSTASCTRALTVRTGRFPTTMLNVVCLGAGELGRRTLL